MKKILVTTFIITSTLVACKSGQKTTASATPAPAAATPAAGTVTYEKDIKPLMQVHCVRCHNENEKAGYNLGILSGVKKGAINGELLGTIKHLDNYDPMPAYADKLSDAAIAVIETWIKEGMN